MDRKIWLTVFLLGFVLAGCFHYRISEDKRIVHKLSSGKVVKPDLKRIKDIEVSGKTVFVAGERKLISLNENLDQRWKKNMEFEIKGLFAGESGLIEVVPADGGGVLSFSDSGELAGKESFDKKLLYNVKGKEKPVRIFEDGTCEWKGGRADLGAVPSAGPCINEGRMYFGTEEGKIYCWSLTDEKMIWSLEVDASIRCSTAVANGFLYVGDEKGFIRCINIEKRKEKWKLKTGGAVRTRPLPRDKGLLVFSYDGYLYSLDPRDGKRNWETSIFARPPSGDAIGIYKRLTAFNTLEGREVKLIDLEKGDIEDTFKLESKFDYFTGDVYPFHSGFVCGTIGGKVIKLDIIREKKQKEETEKTEKSKRRKKDGEVY